jgi:SAM-dependent methyltransferase
VAAAAAAPEAALDGEIERCLRGERLWGDAFDAAGVLAWWRDEQEAFAELVGARPERGAPTYIYHALNERHAFRFLPPGRFAHALGFGSAWGGEFAPLAPRIERLTIVDPSRAWARREVHGIPTRWVEPVPSGALPFDDESFDLVSCLGALHHIANVSAVVRELARCLRSGGHLVVREPVVSLGDWRRPRAGLTRRERGIPLAIFRQIFREAGLATLRESLCAFPLTPRLGFLCGRHPYLDPRAVALDAWLSRLFAWHLRYHRATAWQKLCPTAAYAVLLKRRAAA